MAEQTEFMAAMVRTRFSAMSGTMLWSAGLEAPRQVWVHGWLLAQGERMSKSRGNFLDPLDFVAAFGADGARYVALREAAFDRDTDVSWDGFLRRYNADLANDFGLGGRGEETGGKDESQLHWCAFQ